MNLSAKLLFLIKQPKLIIVTGRGRSCAAEAVLCVLKRQFKIKRVIKTLSLSEIFPVLGDEVLILESDLKGKNVFKKIKGLTKKASLSILVVSNIGEISADESFFAGEKEGARRAAELAKALPPQSRLVLNFDDETVREIGDNCVSRSITFGLQEQAGLQASDIRLNEGTNFKINYRGNIVPVWLKNLFGKEQIYSALAAAASAVCLDMNLVEVSQALKDYHSLPGKMRLLKGNKNSLILDDSENASPQSMLEALDVLAKINALSLQTSKANSSEQGRKIAVLGDVLNIGKYTLEAHEAIGERTARACDMLFTIGPRAKFIAQGAKKAGLEQEHIFEFDRTEEAAKTLEQKIRQGDLILIDGSKEMKMTEVVDEIKETKEPKDQK